MGKLFRGERAAQFLKFSAIGVLNTAAHTAIVVILVELLLVTPASANVFAFLAVTCVSFLLSAKFVFYGVVSVETFLRFVVVVGAGAMTAAGTMRLAGALDLHYLFGVFFLAICLPLLTFLLHRTWTFAKRRP